MPLFDSVEDPRRRILLQALAAGLLSTGAHSAVFGRLPSKLSKEQSFYRLRGSVLVNGDVAGLSTRVPEDAIVETGDNSEAVFVVNDRAFILRSDSKLVLEPPNKESRFRFAMRFVAGAMLAVSSSKRGPTRLNTAVATIGIRGSGYYVESDPEKTYFCMCYGVADIASTDDPESSKTVEATHHDEPLYIVGDAQPGKAVQPGPFINHTDQELQLIETLVGREPPFVFPTNEYDTPRRDY